MVSKPSRACLRCALLGRADATGSDETDSDNAHVTAPHQADSIPFFSSLETELIGLGNSRWGSLVGGVLEMIVAGGDQGCTDRSVCATGVESLEPVSQPSYAWEFLENSRCNNKHNRVVKRLFDNIWGERLRGLSPHCIFGEAFSESILRCI